MMQSQFKGQLKIVLYATEKKITLILLGLKAQPCFVKTSTDPSFVFVKMSLYPDSDLPVRFKTAPLKIQGNFVNLHEKFQFEIGSCSHEKRLLISAWKKCDQAQPSAFMGCMSFSIKNIACRTEVIQGWFYLLRETLGRRKHLKVQHLPRSIGLAGNRRSQLHEEERSDRFRACKALPRTDRKEVEGRMRVQCSTRNYEKARFFCACACCCHRSEVKKQVKVVRDNRLRVKRSELSVGEDCIKCFKESAMAGVCEGISSGGLLSHQYHRDTPFCSSDGMLSPKREAFVISRRMSLDNLNHCVTEAAVVLSRRQFASRSLYRRCGKTVFENEPSNAFETKLLDENISPLRVSATSFPKPMQRGDSNLNVDKFSPTTQNSTLPLATARPYEHVSVGEFQSMVNQQRSDEVSHLVVPETKDDAFTADRTLLAYVPEHSVQAKKTGEHDRRRPNSLIRRKRGRLSLDSKLRNRVPRTRSKDRTAAAAVTGRDELADGAEDKEPATKLFSLKTWIPRRTTENEASSKSSKHDCTKPSNLGRTPSSNRSKRDPCSSCFINATNLSDLLVTKGGEDAFRKFLQSEFSEENLEFWSQCQSFKRLNKHKLEKCALKIYERYLDAASPQEVNVDFRIREGVRTKLGEPSSDMFDGAQEAIFKLMELDPFRRFLSSDFAHTCKSRNRT